jgi:uncharacterized membrane protein YagU involved in acid resistance
MVIKQMMGIMPELDIAQMLTMMLALPGVAFGWLMHFIIGSVIWGGLFALLAPRLPGTLTVRGIVFGIAAWLMMMLAIMPMAGAGLFGMQLGLLAPMMTLMLHIVFGAVLGWVFGTLTAHQPQPHTSGAPV